MGRGKHGRLVWYEEYETCSCTFIVDKKDELPGYCPRHAHNKRIRLRIPDVGFKRGFLETG